MLNATIPLSRCRSLNETPVVEVLNRMPEDKKQKVYALWRSINQLEAWADKLGRAGDYNCQFPEEDANTLRDALQDIFDQYPAQLPPVYKMVPEILLANGKMFNFIEPDASVLDIATVAQSLARQCRYVGHCKEFYSVAQHSVLVSHLVPVRLALQGLMHDAGETVLGDVAAPLKQLLHDYKVIEQRVEAAIFRRFGLPETLDPSVYEADQIILANEMRDNMPEPLDITRWNRHMLPYKPTDALVFKAWSSRYAEMMFLRRFVELTGGDFT